MDEPQGFIRAPRGPPALPGVTLKHEKTKERLSSAQYSSSADEYSQQLQVPEKS